MKNELEPNRLMTKDEIAEAALRDISDEMDRIQKTFAEISAVAIKSISPFECARIIYFAFSDYMQKANKCLLRLKKLGGASCANGAAGSTAHNKAAHAVFNNSGVLLHVPAPRYTLYH
jgi:hypothetical protein